MEQIDIKTGQYVPINYTIALDTKRISAFIIDVTLLIIFSIIIYSCCKWLQFERINYLSDIFLGLRIFFFGLFIPFANMHIEYFCHGQTIGKRLMKIMVINNKCMPPTYSECFLRTILFPIDFSIIGIIVIARSKKNQRIGDFAADTLVVYKSSNKETKIDFSNEFAYTKEGFKPKYKEAAQFTEKDISYIDRVLYNKILTLEEKLAKGFIKKYSIKKQWEEKDRDFLWRLKNDYSYYTNLEN